MGGCENRGSEKGASCKTNWVGAIIRCGTHKSALNMEPLAKKCSDFNFRTERRGISKAIGPWDRCLTYELTV